ncbi:MAG: methyltransferase domain-containing protein [Angelakisella sp.]
MNSTKTSLFNCPVCGQKLQRAEKSYRCPVGHCFDIAGNGYVHLLPANRMNSKEPGDDKSMVKARSEFLGKGYYAPLREALSRLCVQYAPHGAALLDLGCGEGYYTGGVIAALTDAKKAPLGAGIDIAKSAVKLAARQSPTAEFAVASVFHLPVGDNSMDLLLNCFSPLCIPEILRTLKPGGHFLYVVPGAMHLWGLKSAVYAQPYQNEVKETLYEGLRYVEIHHVEDTIHLSCKEDIDNLFRMTPYFWKTSKEDQDKLSGLDTLDTPISFDIHIYKKL